MTVAEHTSESGRIACRFDSPEPVMLADAFAAGHLYRIAQEAVNNAMKHARATGIVIRLLQRNSAILLEVSDNGAGLVKSGNKRGIGLGVMRHRASVIGAELSVESKRGEGVTVRCSLPLKK